MKKVIVAIVDVILGFISLWCALISFVMIVNPGGKSGDASLVHIGWILILTLITGIIGSNFVIYIIHNKKKILLVFQIIPFLVRLLVAFLLTI